MIQKTLPIDEEGYFVLNGGLRLTDSAEGAKLLSQLTLDENSACWTHWDSEKILVEPFDKPYIAQQIDIENNKWLINLPYGIKKYFELESLCLDSSDRFHGLTENQVPFVFSRKAQAEFFNLLDEFDDDSITYKNKKIKIPNFYIENPEVSEKKFWTGKYQEPTPPKWDLNGPHPALESVLPQLKLNKCRTLNLGCGRGHDAAYFAQKGFISTGVDLSEFVVGEAKTKYSSIKNLTFEVANALDENTKWETDLIFEHTLFCAISPTQRNTLVKKWHQSLVPRGHLLGVFFVKPNRGGPPFGSSEWELRALLEKKFRLLYWKRWSFSPPHRFGTELIVYAQKL